MFYLNNLVNNNIEFLKKYNEISGNCSVCVTNVQSILHMIIDELSFVSSYRKCSHRYRYT